MTTRERIKDAAASGGGFGSALLGFVRAQAYSYLVEMAFDWLKHKPGRRLVAENVDGTVEVKLYEQGEEVPFETPKAAQAAESETKT